MHDFKSEAGGGMPLCSYFEILLGVTNQMTIFFFSLQIHLWSYFGGTKTALLDDFDKPLECVNLFIEKKVSILHNRSMYLEFF